MIEEDIEELQNGVARLIRIVEQLCPHKEVSEYTRPDGSIFRKECNLCGKRLLDEDYEIKKHKKRSRKICH